MNTESPLVIPPPETVKVGVVTLVVSSSPIGPESLVVFKSRAVGGSGSLVSIVMDRAVLVFEAFPAESIATAVTV